MENEKKIEKPAKKGFFKALVEKIDKKMEEKSKQKPCCGSNDAASEDSNSCCN